MGSTYNVALLNAFKRNFLTAGKAKVLMMELMMAKFHFSYRGLMVVILTVMTKTTGTLKYNKDRKCD